MARGTDLATLRQMLKAELGDWSGKNDARDSELNVLLSNKQKWLASEYDWPFLQHFWDANCPPNQQYVPLPTITADTQIEGKMNWERPVLSQVFYNTVYEDIEYGIGPDEYNWMNFALGQQVDPIQRWRLVSNGADTFEVWPVPVTNQVVRFTAQRALEEMVADLDVCDLDDMLLVYFVAAEQLLRKKQPDAQAKMALATQRLAKVRAVYPQRVREVVLGGRDDDFHRNRRIVPMIIVAHS